MVIELFNLVVNNKKIIIDNDVVINDELLKTSTIRRLNNVHFNGYLDRLIDDTYELSGTLSGTMILPDDITLEDYEYNFTSSIDEKIDETSRSHQALVMFISFLSILYWSDFIFACCNKSKFLI